ncbi:uncharacterized protein [Lolium perenne]|uniref:uncharacterized protein isoform X1 n=1 Tax=Lolium perenne TaxID=4522 RepID=UPI0021F5ED60|nr:uncharacterized protein LOC127296593 isoform X1 [Lolium perenne]
MPAAAASAAVTASYTNYIPDSVKTFVSDLYRYIRDGDASGTLALYDETFHRLCAGPYRAAPWPPAEAVAACCDNDQFFLILYRELTFRHAHARLPGLLTLKHRADSWDNYCSLFAVVLQGVVDAQLPDKWLWDMVDEFVYQFQRFCQYRAKLKDKSQDQINLLKRFDQAWDVYGVLNYLKALVEKSMIREILEREKEGLEHSTMQNDNDGGSNVLKMLGYYSMIGLLRVHCLIGDYSTGLKCLSPIDINQQGVYTTVIESCISTIYHYGFANIMMHRYSDAIYQFNRILLYMLKYKEYHQKSPQYDLLLKKNEQMYALLAICLSLCPQTNLIDENVSIELKGKYGTQMTKMLRCDGEKYYDELFSFACPKFIDASPSVFYNQDTYRLQLKLFLAEVKQQQLLLGVRSFLKLFSVITIGKLAHHMGSNETSVREILMAYAHKTHAVDNDGHIISNADFDFYIDEDTIHATEPKSIKHHNDYFLKHILKFEEVIGELAQLQSY